MPSVREFSRLHLALIALLALIPVVPLMVHGCSCGHDFDFHLMSWFDAASQLRHGTLHPQWAFAPAYNAGEPRFVFYPPLSWYLGALIGLLLSSFPGVSENAAWSAAPVVFTWVALTASGWTMYRLARQYAGEGAALIAATLYLTNPYMLFTAYERTAFAELLAAAWLPLLVHAALRLRPSLPSIAIPLALLWLTNAPAAVIGSHTLALLTLLRLAKTSRTGGTGAAETGSRAMPDRAMPRWFAYVRPRLHFALTVLAGTGLGLLVAAFYIVPAAYERRYVQIAMAVIPHLRIEDNFIFHHFTGDEAVFHNQVLHTASMVAVLVWGAAVGLLIANHVLCSRSVITNARLAIPVRRLAVLVGLIGFLLTPWSLPVWKHVPEAAFLQFPWRALSMVAVVLALCAAGVLARVQPKIPAPLIAVLLGVCLALPAYSVFRQGCDAKVSPSALLAVFQSSRGADPTDEYTPVTADNDALADSDPPYWLAASPNAHAPAGSTPGPAPAHLDLRLPRAEDLILNLRAYPAWNVLLDGELDLQRLGRDDGLLAVPVPAGVSTIDMVYTRLPDQKIGDICTLLGLGLLTASALPARWRSRVNRGRSSPAGA